LLTGPSGERLEQRAYEPYGVVVRTLDGSVSQSFELAPLGAGNKPTDPHTLWSDHGARWLSPETVRWLSVDPLALAPGKQPNVTPYGYGNENPILFWDPDGNTPQAILDMIDAGVITGVVYSYSDDECNDCYRTVIKGHVTTLTRYGDLVRVELVDEKAGNGKRHEVVSDVQGYRQKLVQKSRETVQKGADQLRAINEVVIDLAASRGGRVDADLPKSAGPCPGGVCGNGICFVGGTPVETKNGPKPIEEVSEGDLVLSMDVETGELDYRPVVRTFVTHSQGVMDLQLVDIEHGASTIGVTPEHPFRVAANGWVRAGDLLPGDELFTSKGGWLWVIGATWRVGTHTVYNFEVADFHTYFAGESSAWVHNTCWDDIAEHVAHRFPGKSKADVVKYLDDFASSAAKTSTENGATIWRRGREILIHRPGAGSGGTYFQADTLKQAESYLQRFIQDNGGIKLPLPD
jgi:RHS repeat-associated protein